ncbi:MAG: hypothetical protein ACE15C_00340 [Phycisphaerae bacterium]
MGHSATAKDNANQRTAAQTTGAGDSLLSGRDKALVLTAIALALAGIVALQVIRHVGAVPPTTTKPGKPADPPPNVFKPTDFAQIRGISIQFNGDDSNPYDKYIKEIAATGANTVCMSVAAFQQNCGSSSIFFDARKAPSKKRLKELVGLAHEQGMRVILMPIVLLDSPREGEWRGKIDPTKDRNTWDDWWKSYGDYILHCADIAQEAKVEIFMVGSELISLEQQDDRWDRLIKQVREHFSGYLSYSANWDHFKADQGGPRFWDKLDIVGMTTYHDLCGSKEPTLDVLMETWAGIKKDVLAWQATVGRPILFTEAAWPNQVTAAQFPWDYYRSMDKKDPQLQKRCFEAFFKTWAGEPAVAGYLVWEWRNYEGQRTGPDEDSGYCPKDKPAMEIISKYFRLPNGKLTSTLPAVTTQPLVAAPQEPPPMQDIPAFPTPED